MNKPMDLMDWKNVERNAVASINEHHVGMTISQILLDKALIEIKRLGGKTQEEEEADLKQQMLTKNDTD
jgi:CRISPR-associated protein Cas8b1/Cst1 subtype I-B